MISMTSTSIKTPHSSVLQAIERLDTSVAIIYSVKDELDKKLYAELISQSLVYAQFLTTCANFGVPVTNSVVKSMAIEVRYFCDFVEKEIS